MKLSSRLSGFLLFLTALLLPFSAVVAQEEVNRVANPDRRPRELSLEEQQALDLLQMLARELKTESDKLAAGKLQARIADQLWEFDEQFAREIFRWSFDAVSQPITEELSDSKRSAYLVRQASALKEVLRRFGAHDNKQAEKWLKALEEEKLLKNSSVGFDKARLELLMQIAVQLAPSDPEQATRLGIVSLSGSGLPDGFGSLLFAISNLDRKLSDQLLRAAIATLRRNQYVHDPMIAINNYLFLPGGDLYSSENLPEARLLANYFVDASWRQAVGPGAPLPASSASFYGMLETRGLSIVAKFAPGRLPELRGQMSRMASGLTPEQVQRTNVFRATQQQQSTIANRNNYSVDEQIERAQKEKDIRVRDALLNSVAHRLMREDVERALTVASKIDDADLRMTTEDDINLVRIQRLLYSRSYDEARRAASKFNNSVFRAKVLAQLAAKVWSETRDGGQATEILSEATRAALKSEDTADKVIGLLHVAEQFAHFDSVRAFDTLAAAITSLNKLEIEKETAESLPSKPRLLTIKSYSVINGMEMMAANNATVDSIDFNQIGSLAVKDYMHARSMAHKIDRPLQRANFLTAVASGVLATEKRRSSIFSANQ